MKKVKFNLLAIVGIMVAIGTFAFTQPVKLAENWYEITNQGLLISMEDFPLGCDKPSGEECAIQLYEPVAENTPRVDVNESEIADRTHKNFQ